MNADSEQPPMMKDHGETALDWYKRVSAASTAKDSPATRPPLRDQSSDMVRRRAYVKGWNDSQAYGNGDRSWNLERSEDDYQHRHGADLARAYAAGWEDYAADNPKYSSL